MIIVYPHQTLGHANHGWLDTHHHFSFADYHNPERMGFGNLRVINDDAIQPGTGFPTHGHQDMEIITYVTKGAVTHRDSQGNEGRTEAGDVQVMTAGSGILHSEYNLEPVETRLFQIWIRPKTKHLQPAWKTHEFPSKESHNALSLLVSGDGKAPLTIHQDAKIYAGNLAAHTTITHRLHGDAYLVVVQGELKIDGEKLYPGDGAEITKTDAITIEAPVESRLLLIEI